MPTSDFVRERPQGCCTRRHVLALAGSVLGWCLVRHRESLADGPADDAERLVRERAQKAGLGKLATSRSDHYVVIGDAPDAFRKKALAICDGLMKDYLKAFTAKGFTVKEPGQPMTVVALASPQSFAAFLGIKPEEAVGGQYDRETNWLVIFDNRARANVGGQEARANTVALIHEAAHQLTFNTGLLSRQADVPLAISEGLAMYAEVRSPDGVRSKVGDVNRERLDVLLKAATDGVPWFTTADLLTREELFDGETTRQLAYAESWLLVYHLLGPSRLKEFRSYLAAIARRGAKPFDEAREAFGPLDRVDQAMVRQAEQLSRRRR